MITMDEFIRHHGVSLRHRKDGNQKTLCPKCSRSRKNKADRCLSVTIDNGKILVCCHNCSWADGCGGSLKIVSRQAKASPVAAWLRKVRRSF